MQIVVSMLLSPIHLLLLLAGGPALSAGEADLNTKNCSDKYHHDGSRGALLVGKPYEGPYTHDFSTNSSRNYFSKTFTEADDKFLQACGLADGRLQFFDHPWTGKENEPLRAAVCHHGPPASRGVVVTVSGTHGIEGFPGSAAQVGILSNLDTLGLPEGYRAVHVHMINPYGASYILKENEDNADVAKNYNRLYDVERGVANPIAVEFIDGLEMWNLGTQEGQGNAAEHVAGMYAAHGAVNVSSALVRGQGERPFGVAYFGPGKSWSTAVMERVVDTYLSDQTSADEILFIDWHTAVGDYGDWVVLSAEDTSQDRFAAWLEGITGVSVMPNGVPSGPFPHFEWVRKHHPSANITRALVEAGTYPSAEYEMYFVLNLYCRFFAGGDWSSETCQRARSQIQEYFYPQGDDFKDLLWQHFVPMWQAMMQRLPPVPPAASVVVDEEEEDNNDSEEADMSGGNARRRRGVVALLGSFFLAVALWSLSCLI